MRNAWLGDGQQMRKTDCSLTASAVSRRFIVAPFIRKLVVFPDKKLTLSEYKNVVSLCLAWTVTVTQHHTNP